MMFDDGDDGKRNFAPRQNLCADHRMHFCLFELSGRQRARLVQNMIRHRELANVMQQRSGIERGQFRFGKIEQLAETGGVNLYTAHVKMRGLILGVYGCRQRFYDRQMQVTNFFAFPSLRNGPFEIELVEPESCDDWQSNRASNCTPLKRGKSQKVLKYEDEHDATGADHEPRLCRAFAAARSDWFHFAVGGTACFLQALLQRKRPRRKQMPEPLRSSFPPLDP